MASGLSKELKVRFGVNAIEVRTNDIVRIMRGKFKKKEGKVVEINMKKKKIGIEGIQRSKTDGTKVNVLVHPSKVQIITFDEEDKKRFKNLNKKEIKDEKKPSSKKVADEKKEVKNLKENKEKENAHKKK